ncbi:MAG: hypothetical protein K0S79_118 [Nitrospira sp.]|jgi:hypothetical protein|nr:hypothetical protein [Nitrospira sp.]
MIGEAFVVVLGAAAFGIWQWSIWSFVWMLTVLLILSAIAERVKR